MEMIKINFSTVVEKKLLELLDDTNSTSYEYGNTVQCRVCLNHECEIFYSIHMVTNNNKSYAEKIQQICSSEIEEIKNDDNLPQHICGDCAISLENSLNFRSLCIESNLKLRLRRIKENKIINECNDVENYNGDEIDRHENDADDNEMKMKGMQYEYIELEINEGEGDAADDNGDDNKTLTENIETAEQENGITKDTSTKEVQNDSNEVIERVSDTHDIPKSTLKPIGGNIHRCEICDIICYSKKSLKDHSFIHKTKKPYECETCKKRFKTKILLKVHTRSHTGERPYICEICGRTFTTWSAVTTHRIVHSDVKQFKCTLCPYEANTKANLRIHDRIHSGVQPYNCSKCPLKFSTASNRSKHMRNIHEKLRSYKCQSCNRSFASKEVVRKHMVIHTGLKPYTCPECPMAYSWYNGLLKHAKTVHENVKIPTEKFFLSQ